MIIVDLVFLKQKIKPKLTFNPPPPPPDTEVVIACFSTSSCFFLFLSTASGFLTPLYVVWKENEKKLLLYLWITLNTIKHIKHVLVEQPIKTSQKMLNNSKKSFTVILH